MGIVLLNIIVEPRLFYKQGLTVDDCRLHQDYDHYYIEVHYGIQIFLCM